MEFAKQHDDHSRYTELPPNFIPLNADKFDPDVWGPHYWFFIHTLAHTYPLMPTTTTKRKYYDFIQNLPLFIPNPDIGDRFANLLEKYPVSPYLDSRDSFIRWTHFIHNKLNVILGKEEISLFAALDNYRSNYVPKQISVSERFHIKKQYIVWGFIFICLVLIFLFYRW
jgi:hypothetical protein